MFPDQKRCATLMNGIQHVLTQYLQVSQTPLGISGSKVEVEQLQHLMKDK